MKRLFGNIGGKFALFWKIVDALAWIREAIQRLLTGDQGVQPANVGVHALAKIIDPPAVLSVNPVREPGQQRRDRRKFNQRVHIGSAGTPGQPRQ